MIITVKKCLNCDTAHEWDFDGPTLKEMRQIKKLTSMAGKAFTEGMSEMDPDAITALLYILHKREKITVPFADIDLDFNDFDMQETEEEKKAREAAEAEEAAEAAAGKKEDPPE